MDHSLNKSVLRDTALYWANVSVFFIEHNSEFDKGIRRERSGLLFNYLAYCV